MKTKMITRKEEIPITEMKTLIPQHVDTETVGFRRHILPISTHPVYNL